MEKYRIWITNRNVMIEVFNECDIADVQKIIIEKGYIIINICKGVFGSSTFMKVELIKKEEK